MSQKVEREMRLPLTLTLGETPRVSLRKKLPVGEGTRIVGRASLLELESLLGPSTEISRQRTRSLVLEIRSPDRLDRILCRLSITKSLQWANTDLLIPKVQRDPEAKVSLKALKKLGRGV